MRIIPCNNPNSMAVIKECVEWLRRGKAVVYPTDTSYGLAVDATNVTAIKRLYAIKGRSFNKPVHVMVSSRAMAKRLIKWNAIADKLAREFWPGPLTMVGKLKMENEKWKFLTSDACYLGVRIPGNLFALALVRHLKRPITATSSNVSGKPDCYSMAEVVAQFRHRKTKPDILIDAGTLPKRKPSTVVRIDRDKLEVLREGPILIPCL